jgi:hypothetical protein
MSISIGEIITLVIAIISGAGAYFLLTGRVGALEKFEKNTIESFKSIGERFDKLKENFTEQNMDNSRNFSESDKTFALIKQHLNQIETIFNIEIARINQKLDKLLDGR